MHLPLSGFHNFVVLSSEQDATNDPSYDIEALRTQFVCPTKDARNLCLSLDQIFTILSSDAVIN